MSPGPPPRAVVRTTLIVGLIALAVYLIYLLRQPITWVIIAAFIAIAISGPINALEARIHRRGVAVAVVYLLLVLLPLGLVAMIVPPMARQGAALARNLPDYASEASDFVTNNRTLRGLNEDFDLTGKLQEQAGKLPGRIGDAAGILGNVGLGLVNSIFALVTILILSVFLVGSGKRWVDAAISMRPPPQSMRLRRTVERIGAAIGAYVAGALAQAIVAGVTSFIVLSILGVPFAAALAVLVAAFDLIPLVGATIGAVIVGVVTLFSDFPTDTIVWVIWSVIYQQIENTLIQPQIQRRAVDVHPFVVLTAVLCGSKLFGVLGALLAIPLAASVQIVIREFLRLRRYEDPEAPLPDPDGGDGPGAGPAGTGPGPPAAVAA
ncbi:MAG TPA: AI-2E family transporter [Solirubrobacteraceae bacterium]|jgi:predicted PurR-regulated permease PerM